MRRKADVVAVGIPEPATVISRKRRRRSGSSVAPVTNSAMMSAETVLSLEITSFSDLSEAPVTALNLSPQRSTACQSSSSFCHISAPPIPTPSSKETGGRPTLVKRANLPSYANLNPATFEHETSQCSALRVHHNQSATQKYPSALHQRRRRQSQSQHHTSRASKTLGGTHVSCDSPESASKFQLSDLGPHIPTTAPKFNSEASRISVTGTIRLPSQPIERGADALVRLFARGLKEAQSKAMENHPTELSPGLAYAKEEIRINEFEVENRLNVHASLLALKQSEWDNLLFRTKADMQAAYKRRVDGLEQTFKATCQEKLDKMGGQCREMVVKAQTASAEAERKAEESAAHTRQAEERLREVEARLDLASKVHNEEIAQFKRDAGQSKHDMAKMRREWEEEKRRLEACIEEERKKRQQEEAAREKELKGEHTRKTKLDTKAKDSTHDLDPSELADDLAVEQQLFSGEEAVGENPTKENGGKNMNIDKVAEDMAKEQRVCQSTKRITRSATSRRNRDKSDTQGPGTT
ncbi:hypothetical protein GALMADRAFT_141790 [Galerina marginata CBS 339.88]|uniref:Uncharacterized protein n=1 Tax=Galerina marginata (strain CBS 339.88) TaxID=685588 RepID=A0A067T299_GALM3|nr:hypothetical protein GALMADRAFT_141790 [Galerina marginata CBS 339.88]